MTPADLGNVQILNQFWTADRQRQFFELLVTKYLPLSEVEISQMQEDPEEFIIVEESVSLFESLRVVTEGTITACEGGNALVDVVKITFGLVTGLL